MRIGFDARAIPYAGHRHLLPEPAPAVSPIPAIEVVVFCQDEEKDTIPPADSFTLVSANMDPLASARARGVSGRWSKSPRSICCTCPAPGRPPRARAPGGHHPRRHARSSTRAACRRSCACATSGSSAALSREVAPDHHRLADLFSALSVYAGVDPAKVRVIHNGVSERFGPRPTRRCCWPCGIATRCPSASPSGWVISGRRRISPSSSRLGRGCRSAWPILPALVLAGAQKRASTGS